MGDGMPYHLEKGPLLRIFEGHLNGNRASLEATLGVLETSEANDSVDWLFAGAPALWNDPAFGSGNPGDRRPTADEMRGRLLTEWFGYEQDAAGNWGPKQPPEQTTGYWIGYRGDVHRIVRTAMKWALKLALGTGSDDRSKQPEPWPIELFWKCPAPWFEAWVVSRRVPRTDMGLVTVFLVSPSHEGASVAESPIAYSAVATPPGASHPIPSWEDDYQWIGKKHPDPNKFPDRPRVKNAVDRDFATWVVTHKQHRIFGHVGRETGVGGNGSAERDREKNTAGPQEFADLTIPQLAMWEGTDNVVVVAPSLPAGGIKHDGKV
jgi:hypothetical protein